MERETAKRFDWGHEIEITSEDRLAHISQLQSALAETQAALDLLNQEFEQRTNWALSAARAISVVQYLIGRGVSPQRLVAAGFGEFQPIDPDRTDEAFSRNRRIELKLTER